MELEQLQINADQATVLITGGSSGIGLEICNAFLAHNANVVNWDIRKSEEVLALEEKFPTRYKYQEVDVSNEDMVQEASQ